MISDLWIGHSARLLVRHAKLVFLHAALTRQRDLLLRANDDLLARVKRLQDGMATQHAQRRKAEDVLLQIIERSRVILGAQQSETLENAARRVRLTLDAALADDNITVVAS